MDAKIIKLDGQHYPYKKKKKRIYKKWEKKHIIESYKLTNVVPNNVNMHQDVDGSIIMDVNLNYNKII